MTDKTLNTIIAHIKKVEEVVEYPYLDNKGLITAGAGFLVNNEADFVKLDFHIDENGSARPATIAEKKAGFRAMQDDRKSRDGKFNFKAGKYETVTNLRISTARIDARLRQEAETRIPKVRVEVGGEAWDKLDNERKAVLVDIHYANGSLKDFPKLKNAVRSGDNAAMARESHFYSGKNDDGTPVRNWDRVIENHRIMGGLDKKAAEQEIYETYKGTTEEANIPPYVRPREAPQGTAPKPDQTSDAAPHADDPKIKSFMADISAPDDEVTEIMYKQPAQLTEGEMKTAMASEPYLKIGHPDRARVVGAVREWHDTHYGTRPVAKDETGRMVEPVAKVAPPSKPTPALGKDKVAIAKSMLGIGGDVANLAGRTGLSKAIKALQMGINAVENGPARALKLDGQFGPKTKAATKTTVASLGRGGADQAFALGRVGLAGNAVKRSGAAKGLGETVHHTVGKLFGTDDAYKPNQSKPWNTALQDTINDMNDGAPGYQPLKPDGILGPKSEDAFTFAAKRRDTGDLISRFGQNLGLFG